HCAVTRSTNRRSIDRKAGSAAYGFVGVWKRRVDGDIFDAVTTNGRHPPGIGRASKRVEIAEGADQAARALVRPVFRGLVTVTGGNAQRALLGTPRFR